MFAREILTDTVVREVESQGIRLKRGIKRNNQEDKL